MLHDEPNYYRVELHRTGAFLMRVSESLNLTDSPLDGRVVPGSLIVDLLRGEHARTREYPVEIFVELPERAGSWHPATTLQHFAGPLLVRYVEHVDGGIDARLFPYPEPAE